MHLSEIDMMLRPGQKDGETCYITMAIHREIRKNGKQTLSNSCHTVQNNKEHRHKEKTPAD